MPKHLNGWAQIIVNLPLADNPLRIQMIHLGVLAIDKSLLDCVSAVGGFPFHLACLFAPVALALTHPRFLPASLHPFDKQGFPPISEENHQENRGRHVQWTCNTHDACTYNTYSTLLYSKH